MAQASSPPPRTWILKPPTPFDGLPPEEKLEGLNGELAKEDVYRDAARMRDTQIEIDEVERELAEANEEWESWI